MSMVRILGFDSYCSKKIDEVEGVEVDKGEDIKLGS
jgi:hypothetical protein